MKDVTKQKEREAEKKLMAMDVDHTKTKQDLKKVQVGSIVRCERLFA